MRCEHLCHLLGVDLLINSPSRASQQTLAIVRSLNFLYLSTILGNVTASPSFSQNISSHSWRHALPWSVHVWVVVERLLFHMYDEFFFVLLFTDCQLPRGMEKWPPCWDPFFWWQIWHCLPRSSGLDWWDRERPLSQKKLRQLLGSIATDGRYVI